MNKFDLNKIVLTKQNHKIRAELDRNNVWYGDKHKKSKQFDLKQECEHYTALLTLHDWLRNFAHINLKQGKHIEA